MSETANTIAAILAIFIVLPVLLLLLVDWLRRPGQRAIQEASDRFMQRLRHPDIQAVAAHFGHALPEALLRLYEDPDELMRSDFEVIHPGQPETRWYIAYYQPADVATIHDQWPATKRYFEFANDGAGNGYLVDVSQADPKVQFHDHETGEFTGVCDSVSDFMRWPRVAVQTE